MLTIKISSYPSYKIIFELGLEDDFGYVPPNFPEKVTLYSYSAASKNKLWPDSMTCTGLL